MVTVKEICFPVIFIDGNDMLFFRDLLSAEKYIEEPDIDNNIYECFDAEGKEIKFKTIPVSEKEKGFLSTKRWKLEIVEITLLEPTVLSTKILKIFDKISAIKKSNLNSMNLSELIKEGIQYFGITE